MKETRYKAYKAFSGSRLKIAKVECEVTEKRARPVASEDRAAFSFRRQIPIQEWQNEFGADESQALDIYISGLETKAALLNMQISAIRASIKEADEMKE